MLPGNASAMILAAGNATRMRPLTDACAKAVVPFLNRPLLDYTLDWLARAGCEGVVINLHHAADSIVRCYGRRAFGIEVTYSHEPALLGTAGGARAALDDLGETTLLVNGDVLSLLNLGALARRHRESGALATLALFSGRSARGYPQVLGDEAGRLLGFPGDPAPEEPGTTRGVFCGVHLVQREVLETVPPGRPCGIVDPVYRELLAAGLPLAVASPGGAWYEVGDPGRYIDAQLRCLWRGDAPLAVAGQRRYFEGGFLSPHTHLENVRVQPPFLLGPGVRIKNGSTLRGVVAGDRARVEAGSRLREVVLWPDAVVGSGSSLRRVVVMDGVAVAPGTDADRTIFTAEGPVPFRGAGPADE